MYSPDSLLLFLGEEDVLRQLQVVPRVTFRESTLPFPEEPPNFASKALCIDWGMSRQVRSVCCC